jgi:hypothetical protein
MNDDHLLEVLSDESDEFSPEDYALLLYAAQYHSDESIQRSCITQLRFYGNTSATRDTLLGLVQNWDFSSITKSELLETIAALGIADGQMVDAIAEHVLDRGYCVADNVCWVLGKLGNATPKVLQALENALGAGEQYFAEDFIHASAAHSLGMLRAATAGAVLHLKTMLHSAVPKEREAAQAALEKLGVLQHE